jgi:hypothetical protein
MLTGVTPTDTRSTARAGDPPLAGRRYVGERCRAGCRVNVVDDAEVHPLRTRGHDPLWSFSWGRAGASARELAWSILYDSAHDAGLAADWCADFTAEVISRLPRESFCLSSRDVLDWLYDERASARRAGAYSDSDAHEPDHRRRLPDDRSGA